MSPLRPDPLNDRRETIADWERDLRSRRDGRWWLWVTLAVLVVALCYMAIARLVAFPTMRVEKPLPVPELPAARLQRSEGATVAPAPAVPDLRPQAPPGMVDIVKCLMPGGKVAYSDGPCPEGSTATTVRVRRDQNLADGMSVAQRQASLRDNANVAARQAAFERQAARDAVAQGNASISSCAALGQEIIAIDAATRQPQSSASLDYWRERRQRVRDLQFRQGCSQ